MEFTEDSNSTALSEPEPSPACLHPNVVSVEFILHFKELGDATLLICTLASAVLQLNVLSRAYRHIRGKTADKCLHVFLFSMTLADFILTGLVYPQELLSRLNLLGTMPRIVYLSSHVLCWISLIVSSFSLVLMNADKLVYFRFPLRYSQYFTRRRSVGISLACWIGSACFVAFAWAVNSFQCNGEYCQQLGFAPNRLHVYIFFLLIASVMPTLTSLIVALYILKIMSIHRKQISQEKLLCSPNTSKARHNSVFMTRMRTFYFIFMSTIFTAATLLPYRFVQITRMLNPTEVPQCSTILVLWILIYMVSLNSIVNPLLTVTILPQYRLSCMHRLRQYHKQASPREFDSTRESL
ncbi:hypothetical protein M3Y94_00880600 [Aphelenchoides besseyi]|nr:hypothetical protein M3Y94_00880600 [Aphelenchoides besseyi]KAI6216753.1 hypothetical protein M3Y95_01261300 [Aphelenchoides besseyi]